MQNALSYYYNLNPDSIHQVGKEYKFELEQTNYVLTIYRRTKEEAKELTSLATSLFNKGIYVHQIVLNNNNEPVTVINGVPYVLLKIIINNQNKIELNDIITFNNYTFDSYPNSALKKDDWKLLWSNKIDYFEYQVSQFGTKYPLIRESFTYFIGLAENAISLLNDSIKSQNLCLNHYRINLDSTYYDLYNTLDIIVDNRIRDVSEFFKQHYTDKNIDEQMYTYFSYNNLSKEEAVLLFARMLFPTFYFDVYEQIMNEELEEESIKKVIEDITNYENFLRKMYKYLKNVYNIPNIEWLNRII